MPEYKDYELVGGQPVKISPFDAAAAGDGVHFAKEGRAFNPVIVSGGAFNPNYVETITGTLANPWGEADYAQLVSDVASKNATAFISVPTMNFAAYLLADVNDNAFVVNGANFLITDPPSLYIAAFARYTSGGALSLLLTWQNGTTTDVTSMLSGSETTLTITHHPLPDAP